MVWWPIRALLTLAWWVVLSLAAIAMTLVVLAVMAFLAFLAIGFTIAAVFFGLVYFYGGHHAKDWVQLWKLGADALALWMPLVLPWVALHASTEGWWGALPAPSLRPLHEPCF